MDNKNNLQTAPSPHDQLSDMIWSFTKAQLIYVTAKFKIADLLQDGPKDAKTPTRSTKIDDQILYRLMRGFAWCGLVDHLADDRFLLTPLGNVSKLNPQTHSTKMLSQWGRLIGRYGVPC